jgi:hypothetical protein
LGFSLSFVHENNNNVERASLFHLPLLSELLEDATTLHVNLPPPMAAYDFYTISKTQLQHQNFIEIPPPSDLPPELPPSDELFDTSALLTDHPDTASTTTAYMSVNGTHTLNNTPFFNANSLVTNDNNTDLPPSDLPPVFNEYHHSRIPQLLPQHQDFATKPMPPARKTAAELEREKWGMWDWIGKEEGIACCFICLPVVVCLSFSTCACVLAFGFGLLLCPSVLFLFFIRTIHTVERRLNIANEVYDTELVFNTGLRVIDMQFYKPLVGQGTTPFGSLFLPSLLLSLLVLLRGLLLLLLLILIFIM